AAAGRRTGSSRARSPLGCRARRCGARPRRACSPSVWPSSCRAVAPGRGRWSCCSAPWARGGFSRDGLALLAVAARADGRGAWETALRVESEDLLAGEISLEDRGAIVGFCERLRGERERASRRTISELVERAIEHSGYELHALGLEWGERRLANLHKL